jgi:glutamate racemase
VTRAPVGVFDSGIGGLGVYAEMRTLLPDVDIVYVADQGFGMYGERTLEEVRHRSELITGWLIGKGVGVVVVACNSASAAALHHLRAKFPEVPFVGMEPAVKPAAERTRNGRIGVLATEATFQGTLFASVVDRFAFDREVITRACPGLAAAIENDDPAMNGLIAEYVGDVVDRGADVIVLGCTHYSLVKERIAAVAGDVEVIDPAPAVARQVARFVDGRGAGKAGFHTTGDDGVFHRQLVERGFAPAVVGTVAL